MSFWFQLGAITLSTIVAAPEALALQGAPEPPGKETTIADYALWIPDGVPTVRGVIAVSNHEAGADIYRDRQTYGSMRGKTLGYRDLARRMGLALFLFKKFAVNNYVQSNQKVITDALSDLAMLSGHPEIRTAGLLPTGLSAGGWYSGWLAQYNPARVIGFFPIAGAPEAFADMVEMRKIPSLYINQGRDAFYPGSGVNTQKVALAGRRSSALWGGHITSPDVEHHNIYKHDAVIVWLEDVVRLRVPVASAGGMPPAFNVLNESDGWLVDLKWHDTNGKAPLIVDGVAVYKFSEAPGDKSALLWMPTERSARALADYLAGNGQLPDQYQMEGTVPAVVRVQDGGAPDKNPAPSAPDTRGGAGTGGNAGTGGRPSTSVAGSMMPSGGAPSGSTMAPPVAPDPAMAVPERRGSGCHMGASGRTPSGLGIGLFGLVLALWRATKPGRRRLPR